MTRRASPNFCSNPLNKTLYFPQICIILLILLAACNEAPPPPEKEQPDPTATPADTPTPFPTRTPTAEIENLTPTIDPSIPTPIPAWFEGVYADIPTDLASLEPLEAVTGQLDSNLPIGQRFPSHSRYLIDGWPIDNFGQQPQILAFSARDYASVNVLAQIEIDKLKQLLSDEQSLDNDLNLPFLPVQVQSKPFSAQPKLIPFQSGQGVRYLTWLPSVSSTNSTSGSSLLYAWQGITADGRGVVSALFPIEVKREFMQFTPPVEPNLQSLLEQWGKETGAELDQLPAEAFIPSLDKLDQIVASIFANLPEPELRFDENGKVDLTIVYPRNNGETLLGRELEVEGYVQPGEQHEISLSIFSSGDDLSAQTVESNIDGWWTTTIYIPENVQGDVTLSATGNGQTDSVEILLVSDPTSIDQFTIDFLRPAAGQTVIAGHPAFIEGRFNGDLVDDTLKISLLTDNCQTLVASDSLTILPNETNWYTVLPIPPGLSGSACFTASTGAYGQPGWRVAKNEINISPFPPDADQITIGNSINLPLSAGTSEMIFGTAFSNSNSSILIKIKLPDGSVLSEGETTIDENNFWEYSFEIPSAASGRLLIEARFENQTGSSRINEIVTLPIQSP